MEFHVEDIQGEEREGYYVPAIMKRAWAVQLDILKVIDAVCRRHQIKYYGWYGTLLGAVRHRGFIPWDDDLDLAMLREDYEKFQYYVRAELPEGWKLLKVKPTLIRILNTEVIRFDQEFLDKYHGCPYAMGVDIFCMDCISSNKDEEELHLNLFNMSWGLYEQWEFQEEDEQWEENRWKRLERLEEITGYHFDDQCSVKDQLYVLTDKIAAVYWNAECKEVANVPWLFDHRHCRTPVSGFEKVIEVPFENTWIPILKDYDPVCKSYYGENYMIPKKEYLHDSLNIQINLLRNYFSNLGESLPECFDMIVEKQRQ